jgi:AbrB family looped-hinge helix DNA binding protein
MSTTTISPKYQVVIPKDVRKKFDLKRGQRMTVVTKGDSQFSPFGQAGLRWIFGLRLFSK